MGDLLKGRVAVITGSGSSVGKYAALSLAAEGCRVVTNSRKPGSSFETFVGKHTEYTKEDLQLLRPFVTDAQDTADEINAAGGEAVAVFGSITEPEVCRKLIDTAVERWGRLDILINAANTSWVGSVEEMSEDKWDIQIDSKLKHQYLMTYYAVPYMKKQGYGRIINCASDAFQGLMGMSAYGAASNGTIAFTKAVAQDLAAYGITANVFSPLALARSFVNTMITYREQGVPMEVVEAGAPKSMKRLAKVFTPFLAYLASEEAGNITGQHFNLQADGEIALWSDPEMISSIKKEEGDWTIDEIRSQIDTLMTQEAKVDTAIPLK